MATSLLTIDLVQMRAVLSFLWVPKIQNPVLMCVSQGLYPVSPLPRTSSAFSFRS